MISKLLTLENYCRQQYPVFPLHWCNEGQCSCGSTSCNSPGKHPLVAHGFKDATSDLQQVLSWHSQWPTANWGMRTGNQSMGGSGILVVDIDAKSGGYDTWEQLRVEHLEPIETVTVATGGGGQHLWFAYPDNLNIRSKAGVLGPGIDIRANDGYVLVPPSETFAPYKFLFNPEEVEIAPCPRWILDLLNITIEPHVVKLPAGLRIGAEVPQGARHQALLTMAGAMRRIGMTHEEMITSLEVVRENRFQPGSHVVTDEEIIDIVDWVSHKQRLYAFTDLGNAERFVELFGALVRYCAEWEEWLVWDGQRWCANANAELMQMAHATVRRIHSEAAHAQDLEQRRVISKHTLASEAHSRVENMLLGAKPYLTVHADQLDQHPMLLNVANGVVDLSTMTLLPHDPDYLITKLINVSYDPAAECFEWTKFLELVTGGDQALQGFLQLAVGYTLTGRTDAHCLFVLYGTGANGKTTFTEFFASCWEIMHVA